MMENNQNIQNIKNIEKVKYAKVLTYTDLIYSNLGYIIGAGIFVLLTQTIKIAGKYAWMSVILAGLFIIIISKKYIIIFNIYNNTNDPEFEYIKDIYGNDIQKIIIFIMIIGLFLITYIVFIGFGEYTNTFFNNIFNSKIFSIIGLLISIIFNILSIEITVDINRYITILGLLGLFIIIILGLMKIKLNNLVLLPRNILDIYNIIYGAFIFVFAYTGFEMVLRLNKETIDKNIIPSVINNSIIITIVLYTLIAIITINLNIDLNNNKPLSLVINKLTKNKFIIKYIELCGIGFTWNTGLLSITYISRLIYDIFNNIQFNTYNNNTYNFFSINNNTKTPINIIIIIGILLLILIIYNINILTSTIITNSTIIFIMLLIYFSKIPN